MSKKEEIEKLEEEVRLQELRLKKKKLDDEEYQIEIAEHNKKVKLFWNIIFVAGLIFLIIMVIGWFTLSEDEKEDILDDFSNKKSPEISKSIPGLS